MDETVNKDDLKNNVIVRSGFLFNERRPLGFFEFDEDTDKSFFKNKTSRVDQEFDGKLVVKDYGFEPTLNGEKLYSPEVFVVSRSKARRILILQNMDFTDEFTDNVFVIPIQSLKKPKKEYFTSEEKYSEAMLEYQGIKNRDEDLYDLYYFPRKLKNGQIYERVLVLSDARFIHKSLLFKVMDEEGLNQDELKEINVRIGKMLNIGQIERCKTCETNCDNCELIFMYENLKGVLQRADRKFICLK